MGDTLELLHRLCSPRASADRPRLLIVAAHPDDDVIGAGARLSSVAPRAHVVYVSDGAPNNPRLLRESGFGSREAYAAARREEARRALELAGLSHGSTRELGAVDQEVALALPRLARELCAVVEELAPELVLTHPYEGGHPDHDATALLVRVARKLLRRAHGLDFALGEFASYHDREGALAFGQFLPHPRCAELCVDLTARELDHKLSMLECHASQRGVWRLFPLGSERFRTAPDYDFSAAPAAPFFYDRMDWAVRGSDFLALSRAVLAEFGIEGSC